MPTPAQTAAPLLDLRRPQAFLAAHCPHAVNIPAPELASRMQELPEKGASLRVYHDDPSILAQTIILLNSRGYLAQPCHKPPLTQSGPSTARLWSPSPLLLHALTLTPRPGIAADLGCGSARESVFLAMRHWHVDAYDILPDALQKARDLASRHHVSLNTLQQDLAAQPTLRHQRYDLICLFRFWLRPLLPHLLQALAPGGLLVIEAFHPDDAQGDPRRRPDSLITPQDLAASTPHLHIHLARHSIRNARHLTQFIARSPLTCHDPSTL